MAAVDAPARESARYAHVAIALHWLIAVAILVMIPMGFWMHKAAGFAETRAVAYQTFQVHKSIGVTILALSFARLAWRLAHKPPPLPAMPAWEAFAARAAHALLYVVMIGAPLSGWLYVSTGWSAPNNAPLAVPTVWFGLVQIPHLPFFHDATNAARKSAAEAALTAHAALAWGGLGLVVLHAGAALKHHFMDKDDVLVRMLPWARKSILWPIAAGVLAALAVTQTISSLMLRGTPPPIAAQTAPAPISAEAPPAEPTATTPIETQTSAAPPAPGAAPVAWKIDKANSRIEFSGAAPAGPFTGQFGAWSADVRFSPDALAASTATVTIRMESAVIPDPTGTAALKEDNWFAVSAFPTATFKTTGFRHLAGDRYEADGVLTIRDKSAPVSMPFLLRIENGVATVRGSTKIDRLTFGVGQGVATTQGADMAWASGSIAVAVTLRATH